MIQINTTEDTEIDQEGGYQLAYESQSRENQLNLRTSNYQNLAHVDLAIHETPLDPIIELDSRF